jgi:homoserine O-succinyltransferase/O-acetyltransferase
MSIYPAATHAREIGDEAGGEVVVAFVNNMPDAAIRSSERQFRGLLQAAAGDLKVNLQGYYCPEVPRSDIAKTTLLQPYQETTKLWCSQIDGLIVTGAEPRAENITDEPYWPFLARLIDWAEEHTISTIWSCLAAHAAVFSLSGITRKPLTSKLSGLFKCTKPFEHPLTEGTPECWYVPQSRYNGLPEDKLEANGFQALTRLDVGYDSFIRQGKSLFLFFQGHPEYDPESLLLEYIRDVKRFIEGEREIYPEPPVGYFDREMLQKLEDIRVRALQRREQECFTAATRLLQGHQINNVWRSPSTIIFQNWLKYLANRKSKTKRREVCIGELAG